MRLIAGWQMLPAPLRKLIVLVIGGTVVLIGIVMLLTPGPASLVIPAGLAILSLEFVWARHLLRHYKATADRVVRLFWRRTTKTAPPSPPPPET